MKPTEKEIEKVTEFANRGATSTMDAIHKKMIRNALKNKDYSDPYVREKMRE